MLSTILFATAVLLPPSLNSSLQGQIPELDSWKTKFSHPSSSGMNAMFQREDKATLSLSTATFKSNADRLKRMSAIEDNMQNRPQPGTAEYASIRSSLTGNPLADTVYRFENPDSGSIMLIAGAENVSVSVRLSYQGSGRPGSIRWNIGDLKQDRVLVEDIVRRMIGQLLAGQYFPESATTLGANTIANRTGKSYVSLGTWASKNRLSLSPIRGVGTSFRYKGKDVQLLMGSDAIRIANKWVPLNAFVLDVDGKPYVDAKALEKALK